MALSKKSPTPKNRGAHPARGGVQSPEFLRQTAAPSSIAFQKRNVGMLIFQTPGVANWLQVEHESCSSPKNQLVHPRTPSQNQSIFAAVAKLLDYAFVEAWMKAICIHDSSSARGRQTEASPWENCRYRRLSQAAQSGSPRQPPHFGTHQSITIIGEQPVRRTRAGSTDPDERIWTIRRKFIRKMGRCDRLGKNLSASVDIPTGVMLVMGAWGVMGACGRGENLTWYLVLHQ